MTEQPDIDPGSMVETPMWQELAQVLPSVNKAVGCACVYTPSHHQGSYS